MGAARKLPFSLLQILCWALAFSLTAAEADEDDWLRAPGSLGKPHEVNRKLLGVRGSDNGVNYWTGHIHDPKKSIIGDAKLMQGVAFSPDGRFAYVVETQGVIHKVAVPSMVEERKIALGVRCRSWLMTPKALVLAVEGDGLWTVDPDTLAIRKKIPVPQMATPFASIRDEAIYLPVGGKSDSLFEVNLETGKPLRRFPLRLVTLPKGVKEHPDARLVTAGIWKGARALPDGKTIITARDGRLLRFTIKGSSMEMSERTSNMHSGHAASFHASPDGKFAIMSANETPPGYPAHNGAYVFDVKDLSQPVSAYPGGYAVFHPQGLLFSGGSDRLFAAYNRNGGLLTTAVRTTEAQRGMALAPDGRHLVVVTEISLHFLEISDAILKTPAGEFGNAGTVAVADKRSAPLPDWLAALRPQSTNAALAGNVQTAAGGLRITPLKTDGQPMCQRMCWSEDGEFLYVVEAKGLLRKVRASDLTEAMRLEFPSTVSSLEMSAEGLVAALPERQSLVVLDPATLQARKAIAAAVSGEVACTATSSRAFVAVGERHRLAVVDLKSGVLLSQLNQVPLLPHVDHNGTNEVLPLELTCMGLRITSDGKRLLVCHEGRQVMALRVLNSPSERSPEGAALDVKKYPALHYIEYMHKCAGRLSSGDGNRIVLSPDGMYVGVLCFSGDFPDKADPLNPAAGTKIFRTRDLPTGGLLFEDKMSDVFAGCLAMGFDVAAQAVYASNRQYDLTVYTRGGVRGAQYSLDYRDANNREVDRRPVVFLPHPAGKKLICLTQQNELLWLEIPDVKSPAIESETKTERLDWFATAESHRNWMAVWRKMPTESGAAIKLTALEVPQGKAWKLDLPAVMDWVVVPDGKTLYVLSRTALQKIAVIDAGAEPKLVEQRQMTFTQNVRRVSLSSAGIVIVPEVEEELWIHDAESLEQKRRLPLPSPLYIGTAQESPVAIILQGTNSAPHQRFYQSPLVGRRVAIVDLAKGAVAKQYEENEIQRPNPNPKPAKGESKKVPIIDFRLAFLFPDAKGFVCLGHSTPQAFRLSPNRLTLQSTGQFLSTFDERIWLSSDRKYLAAAVNADLPRLDDHPRLFRGGVYVYRVADLKRPVMALDAKEVSAACFDKAAGQVHVASQRGTIISFAADGTKVGEARVVSDQAQPFVDLSLVTSGKMLARSNDGAFWIETATR